MASHSTIPGRWMEFCDKEHCSENGDEVVGILASYSVGT
jgi:hypothetical protein